MATVMEDVATGNSILAPRNKVHLYRDRSGVLHTGLLKYFNKSLFSDLTIVAPDGRKLLCHQVVLSSCSKRFANMLEQGTLNGEELPVWGVDSDALELVLLFFYSGEIQLAFSTVVAVYDAAQRLEVPGLAGCCEKFIRDVLQPSTCCTLLRQAQQFKMEELVNQCLAFIKTRFEEVMAEDDFLCSSFGTVMKVITSNKSAQPELSLFRAAWSWVTSDVKHVQYLEELLKVVKVPDITMQDLLKLGSTRQSNQNASGSSETAQSHFPIAQQPTEPTKHSEAPSPDKTVRNGFQTAAVQLLQQAMLSNMGFPMVVQLCPPLSSDVKRFGAGSEPSCAAPNTDADELAGYKQVLRAGGLCFGQPSIPAAAQSPQLSSELVAQLRHAGLTSFPMSATMPTAVSILNSPPSTSQAGLANSGAEEQPSCQSTSTDSNPKQYDNGEGQAVAGEHLGAAEGGQPYDGPLPPPCAKSDSVKLILNGQKQSVLKGMCQVDGCYTDLSGLRDYHLRYKICEYHLKISSIMKDGKAQRFCQQCGRFHYLTEFDGNKRSCRARLQRHNARRRKRPEPGDAFERPPSTMKKIRMLEDDDQAGFAGQPLAGAFYRLVRPATEGSVIAQHLGHPAAIISAIQDAAAIQEASLHSLGSTGAVPGSSSWGLQMLADAANQDVSKQVYQKFGLQLGSGNVTRAEALNMSWDARPGAGASPQVSNSMEEPNGQDDLTSQGSSENMSDDECSEQDSPTGNQENKERQEQQDPSTAAVPDQQPPQPVQYESEAIGGKPEDDKGGHDSASLPVGVDSNLVSSESKERKVDVAEEGSPTTTEQDGNK